MSDAAEPPPRARFLDLAFDCVDEAAALDRVFALAGADRFAAVVTPNVDHVVALAATDNPDIRAAYDDAALCLCDSRILAMLARWSGILLPVVPGSDLTASVLDDPRLAARRVAVVGASAKALAWLRSRRPDVEFRQWIPPFGVRDNLQAQAEIIDFVERSAACIVLFAIGAPQSELMARRLALRDSARGVGLCIGASIDFLTGDKRRAPRLLQRARLEWAHRLFSEPTRLWRRYLVRGPRIFAIWLRWRGENGA